jgi:hypothetical protein
MDNITAYENAMDKLTAYEALGYTPEQLKEIIKELQKRKLNELYGSGKYGELKAKDILVVRCNSYLKSDEYSNLYECLQNQKAMGVVLLPNHLEAIVVPNDIEIKIEEKEFKK